jgi:hypothetical protein
MGRSKLRDAYLFTKYANKGAHSIGLGSKLKVEGLRQQKCSRQGSGIENTQLVG